MEPLGLSLTALTDKLSLPVGRRAAVINGTRPVDTKVDRRRGRYFGLSESFFLGLQNQHDLLEAKRALWPAIQQVEPRQREAT